MAMIQITVIMKHPSVDQAIAADVSVDEHVLAMWCNRPAGAAEYISGQMVAPIDEMLRAIGERMSEKANPSHGRGGGGT